MVLASLLTYIAVGATAGKDILSLLRTILIYKKFFTMKSIRIIAVVFLITLAGPRVGTAQDSVSSGPQFEIHRIYPFVSIAAEKLAEAQTLTDINTHFKAAWVKEYISVELLASYRGKQRKALSQTDKLTPEQKDLIHLADVGTEISIKVRYMPENNLPHNDIKEMGFTFTVEPESEARFSGDDQQLRQFLKERAIDKIPEGTFKDLDLAAVTFAVDNDGEIIDVHLFEASKDEKIDALLLETVRSMPSWRPAQYSNGVRVKQEFVLTVGSMEKLYGQPFKYPQGPVDDLLVSIFHKPYSSCKAFTGFPNAAFIT